MPVHSLYNEIDGIDLLAIVGVWVFPLYAHLPLTSPYPVAVRNGDAHGLVILMSWLLTPGAEWRIST